MHDLILVIEVIAGMSILWLIVKCVLDFLWPDYQGPTHTIFVGKTEQEKLDLFISDLKRTLEANKKFYADANKLIAFVTKSMQLLGIKEIHNGLYSLASPGWDMKADDVDLCIKPEGERTHYCLTDAITDDGLLNKSFGRDFGDSDDYKQAQWMHVQMFVADFYPIIDLLRPRQEHLLKEVPQVDFSKLEK